MSNSTTADSMVEEIVALSSNYLVARPFGRATG